MKKILTLTLVLAMSLSLISCSLIPSDIGGQNDDGKGSTPVLSRGTIEGNVYTSEYLGVSFTKPESWVYSTDEEIAAAVNMGVDMFINENFKDALENNLSIYDMMVIDSVTRSNINVGFENLAKSFSSNITVDQYIESLKSQLAQISSMNVTFPESSKTVKLSGTEFTKLQCTTTTQGITFTQVYYLRKVDKYIGFIIATIPSGYSVEEIEAMFD